MSWTRRFVARAEASSRRPSGANADRSSKLGRPPGLAYNRQVRCPHYWSHWFASPRNRLLWLASRRHHSRLAAFDEATASHRTASIWPRCHASPKRRQFASQRRDSSLRKARPPQPGPFPVSTPQAPRCPTQSCHKPPPWVHQERPRRAPTCQTTGKNSWGRSL